MTKPISIMGSANKYFPGERAQDDLHSGRARVAAYRRLPEVLGNLGIDVQDVLDEVGLPPDIFDDPDRQLAYADLGRLLAVSARRSKCEHIALLLAERVRLADMGLAGRIATTGETVHEGLQRFLRFFILQNTAATVSLVTSGSFARLVYAISEHNVPDTQHFQLGAMTIAFNVMQDLCGPSWQPAQVMIASHAPSNLRPCQTFFRAPLHFNSEQSAIVFEGHWLDRLLPRLDPLARRRIETEVRLRRDALPGSFPASVRRILRQRLMREDCSMDTVAAQCGMHRRTLHRLLLRQGVSYRNLLDSVQEDVARQLLRDTALPVQQVAEALRYSNAANFATAFRRWTGVTPTEFRHTVDAAGQE